MRIDDVRIDGYRVALKAPFKSAAGAVRYRSGMIVSAATEDFFRGFGEIAPLRGFSNECEAAAYEAAIELGRLLRRMLVPENPEGLKRLLDSLPPELISPPSVRFGIETMLADLSAQWQKLQLATWWNPDAHKSVAVNAVLSLDSDRLMDDTKAKIDNGYKALKLKVGAKAWHEEAVALSELRKLAGEDVCLRLDANRAYDYETAIRFCSQIADLGVDYIEEPLRPDDLERLPELRLESGVRIALDETTREPERFRRLLDAKVADVVILKPTLLGGTGKALDLAEQATAAEAKVVVTTTLEAGVGTTACLHLAAALADDVLPCGLDTLSLFEDSLIVEPLEAQAGFLRVPDKPGLGVTIKPTGANADA